MVILDSLKDSKDIDIVSKTKYKEETEQHTSRQIGRPEKQNVQFCRYCRTPISQDNAYHMGRSAASVVS